MEFLVKTVYAAPVAPTTGGINSAIVNQTIQAVINVLVNPTIVLFFALSTFWFVWGILQFLKSSDEDTERQAGLKHIMYGVILFVLMFSAVAILKILLNTAGLALPLAT